MLKAIPFTFLLLNLTLSSLFANYAEALEDTSNNGIRQAKTLTRWPDPVVVSGDIMPQLDGVPIELIRVYASTGGKFDSIRFQVDEKTTDLDWVLPEGPKANAHLGNGTFDTRDVLVFMASDTGDRVPESAWTPGREKGIELEIIDPINQQKAWCYVLVFASNPPPLSALPPYIHYKYDTEEIWTDYYRAKYIITEDGMHTTYYEEHSVPEKAGGNGENFIDRLKIRTTIRLFFGLIPIRLNEEALCADVLAYRIGPVRMIRRLDQFVKLPFGVKALRAITDVQQYRNIHTVPIRFEAPMRIDKVVSSMVIRFGSDYAPTAKGSMLYNSSNPQGFLVDGQMDDSEHNFNAEADNWRVMTGEFGTFLTRSVFTEEILESLNISMGLIDDESEPDPPEKYPGNIGHLWQDWNVGRLHAGVHFFYLEFYFPPHYQLGDEKQYLNYLDHPLQIVSGDRKTEGQIIFQANIGKDFYRE